MSESALARQLLRFQLTGHPHTQSIGQDHVQFAESLTTDPTHKADTLEEDYPLAWVESKRQFNTFLRRWRQLQLQARPQDLPLPQSDSDSNSADSPGPSANSPGPSANPPTTDLVPRSDNSSDTDSSNSRNSVKSGKEHASQDNFDFTRTLPKQQITSNKSPVEAVTPLSSQNRKAQTTHTPVTPGHLTGLLPIEELSSQLSRFRFTSPSPHSENSPSSDAPPTPSRSPSDPQSHTESASPGSAMAEPLTMEEARRLLREAAAAQNKQHTRDMAALLSAQADQNNQNMAALLAANRPEGPSAIRSADVGYFDPSAKDPTFAGLIADGKTTKYTDVFAFTDRLKHLATQQGDAEVRKVWTQCLLGPALIWHSQVLSAADRQMMETATIDNISNKLIERFKPSWSSAMGKLQNHQFTLEDVYKGHDMLAFVQRVIRDAKGCDQNDTNQLKAAFEAFDGDIQSQLHVPTDKTSLDDFLNRIRDREGVLKKMAKDKYATRTQSNTLPFSPSSGFPNRYQVGANQYNQRRNFRGRGGYRGSPQYGPRYFPSNYQRTPLHWEGSNQTQGQDQWQANPPAYPTPNTMNFQQQRQRQPQPALIPENRRLPAPPPRGPAAWQQNQQSKPQRAYYGEEHIEDHPDPHQENENTDTIFTREDFETFTQEPPWDESISYDLTSQTATDYQSPSVEPAEDCNFASVFHGSATPIKHTCRICRQHYPSKNKLHRHLQDTHGIQRNSNEPQSVQHAMDIPNLLNSDKILAEDISKLPPEEPKIPTEPRNEVPKLKIIMSKSIPLPGLGTGYGFKSYGYLKFFVTPDLDDPQTEYDVCGDTGCSKTLADKQFIKEKYPNIEWRTRATPFTFKGIGATLHSTDQYVLLPLYFQGKVSPTQTAVAHLVYSGSSPYTVATVWMIHPSTTPIHDCSLGTTTIPLR
ncbi:hypothetical protein F5Y03DRAFT_45514 [Xylaria venustula]|nr:hypothetical protein F5Y03DRAFT_45514 [Xylaria venustula]